MKITIDDVEAACRDKQFHRFPDTHLTVCCVRLANGYCVTGESGCVDPKEFNAELGRKLAYEKARDKVWGLLAYDLANRMQEDADRVSGYTPGGGSDVG